MSKQTTVTLANGHYWHCDDCDAYSLETGGNLYECGSCGELFTRETSANDNHQCPDCLRFGSKTGDQGCIDCGAAPVEQWEAEACSECDEIVDAGEIDENGICSGCADDADADDADADADADGEQGAGEPMADKVWRLWNENNAMSVIADATGLPLNVVRTLILKAQRG